MLTRLHARPRSQQHARWKKSPWPPLLRDQSGGEQAGLAESGDERSGDFQPLARDSKLAQRSPVRGYSAHLCTKRVGKTQATSTLGFFCDAHDVPSFADQAVFCSIHGIAEVVQHV